MADRERCVPLVDDDGQVVASVRVTGELGERGRQAMLDVVAAVMRAEAEADTADPERVAHREAARRRREARVRRWRGEQS
ncbi:hypothetical protein AB0J14_04395 [Micromonospora arborensis]|uniref:hypothetical protein n=1 Tax=Micromonospora arborensis TaxID=2116518 RepID=UPI0033D53EEC